jgi:hypothetical protein
MGVRAAQYNRMHHARKVMKKASRFFFLICVTAGLSFAQAQLIGVSSVGATLDSNNAGQAEAFLTTATVTGSVTSMSVYLDSTNGAKTVYVGVYSNSNGHPATLLGAGAIAVPSAGAWNTVSLSPAVQVSANTSYHIALLGTGGSIQFRDALNGTHSETSSQTNLTSLPASWSSGAGWGSGPLSAYGSGSSGSGAGGVQVSISPASVTVKEGSTQQFNAAVTGTSNTGVNWSVTSGTGTVSASGLFTAPNRQETDTVRAQAQADATKTASASVTVPAVGIQISPTSATVSPNGAQQFTATVSGTVNTQVTWSEIGKGSVNQSGLYTAPSTNESDIVRATAAAAPSPSADASVTVQATSNSACGNTLNWTNSQCQQIAAGSLSTAVVNGVKDPSAWTVVSRHGEYSQSETECNVPGAVSVANGALILKVSAASATCGDFDPSTGARCSGLGSPCPGTFPYSTGDVQWNTFSFKYGVLVVRAKFPTYQTSTWPAVWMLGTNCQNSNKYTGDTGLNGCPNITQAGYREVDNAEFLGGPSRWGLFNIANPGWTYTSTYATAPVDGNYHVFSTVWTSSGMSQYMDGLAESSTSQTVNGNLFLILQIQTGGVGGTPVNSLLPATMNVDYVKVCNSNYSRSQCEAAPATDANVIFWDDFGGPAQ